MNICRHKRPYPHAVNSRIMQLMIRGISMKACVRFALSTGRKTGFAMRVFLRSKAVPQEARRTSGGAALLPAAGCWESLPGHGQYSQCPSGQRANPRHLNPNPAARHQKYCANYFHPRARIRIERNLGQQSSAYPPYAAQFPVPECESEPQR